MNSTDLYLPILFWTFAATTVGGSLAILFVKDIVRCAFLLMMSFSGVAGLYLLLGAEFLAFAQILIYVGGILILILFGVMLTQRNPILVSRAKTVHLVIPGTLCAGILATGLVYVVLRVDWVTKPGEEVRVHLESAPAGEEGAGTSDPHALDGWIEESGGALHVRDAEGTLIARFVREEEDGRRVARKVTRVDVVELALFEDEEAGSPVFDIARDFRGRPIRRSLYGRLERSGRGVVLAQRDGEGVIARYEPRAVPLTGRAIEEILGTSDLPDELSLGEDESSLEVTLFANPANDREVVSVALAGDEPAKNAYSIVRGVKANPATTPIDEFVVEIGPALDATPVRIGKALMTDFLLPFEVASVLLLAALVGATLIARRGGVEGAR